VALGQRSSVALEHSLYSYSKVPRDQPSLPEVSIDQQWAHGRGPEAKLHTHTGRVTIEGDFRKEITLGCL
jgi:hypothetical protein